MTSSPPQGIGSLFTLIKRLEAATSRLEDIALSSLHPGGTSPAVGSDAALFGVAPVDASGPSPAPPPAAAAAAAAAPADPSVAAFDQLISGPLAQYVSKAESVGGPAAEQAAKVRAAFSAQRAFLAVASACTKPSSMSALVELLKPTSEPLEATLEVKDAHRGDRKLFNGLNAVAEGIQALGWVALDSKPGSMVGESKESAQFWANRVVKEFKDTEPILVEWVRSFIGLLEDLRKYIVQHHTVALTWNAKGEDATAFAAKVNSGAPAGGPPPPPPPPPPPAPGAPAPPPPPPAGAPLAAASSAGGMDAVFAQLNQGEDVAKGLRKVDKTEMTHKNPGLRGTAPVPSGPAAGASPKRPQKPPKPQSFVKKPPKLELSGNKWAVEYYDGKNDIILEDTEISQIVNIFSCKNSTIQVKGKVNAITLVSCSKTSVLLDSVVSSLSITSSSSFTVQVLGKVPTIMVDATDGGQVYLSKDSLDVEIVTAKCSALNVSVPVEGEEEGAFTERAVPEQLKTVISGGKLVTTVLEHAG